MMKIGIKFLVMVLGFWSLNVNAELNIVVLDSVRAILESDEAKILVEAANTEMEEEANELRGMAQTMQDKQSKLQTDGEVMSASEKRKIAKEIEDAQIDIQFRQQKLQKEVQDSETQVQAHLLLLEERWHQEVR